MRNVSWHSFADVSAYNQALDEALREAARWLLAEQAEVLGVWLFGSRALGRPAPRSDVDVLLLVERARPRMMDRVLDYGALLDRIPAPVDLLVLEPGELAAMAEEPFYRRLISEARPLACRAGANVPKGLRRAP